MFEALRIRLQETTPSTEVLGEVVNETIENVEKIKVKRATHAYLKRAHSKTKKRYGSVRQSIAFSKTRKQNSK